MITDALLAFVPADSPLSLVGAAGVDFQSNVIDLMGPGVNTTIQNIFGNSAQPGQADAMGVGDPRPEISVIVGTALATASAATVSVELQGAPDSGSGVPGTWQVFGATPFITAAQGAAGTQLCRLPFLPPFPFNERPRFLRLNFNIPSGVDFTAGTIASALVTTVRDDYFVKQQPNNFTAPRYNHP